MKFKIRDIQANPFRHIDRYPIRKDKVAALRESLRTTGFWDNVVARVNGDGKPQIAYGHHRLFALREEYASDHEVSLIVRDLSDDQMLKIMARENLEEWGTSAAVEHETVRAVVEAYAEGKIELPSRHTKTVKAQVRYAPSFVQGDAPEAHRTHPYTAQDVADYLAWQIDKVGYALGALELIEEGLLKESHFDGLGTAAARRIVEETRKAKREREIREREQRQAAERARREAEQAHHRREQAEAERTKREQQAARAREETDRRRREEQARRARVEAEQAERERQQAERRRRDAEKRAQQEQQAGREQARRVGRQASEGLKSGKGYADPDLVDHEKRQRDRKPPEIDEFAYKLAARLNKMLDPDFDERARELDRVLTYQQHLGDNARRELDIVLGRVIERAATVRKKLAAHPLDVIDAEVIEAEEITS